MLGLLKRFERAIAWVLAILLLAVTSLATVDLTVTLIKNILYEMPYFLVGVDELLDLFGLFLLILLGLELLETVKAYLQDDVIHVEVADLIVAIIALARKVIILEFKDPTPSVLLGLAALVIALAAAYRLIMQVIGDASSVQKEARTLTWIGYIVGC